MDSYQAIYDAVRSKISGGDIDQSIETVLRESFGMVDYRVQCALQEVSYEMCRPFILLKPKLYIEGDMWCALYGENLQDGVAGFGETPDKAAHDFDRNWSASKAKNENPQTQQ